MICTVVHTGVPIGTVELPDGRLWAGGLLSRAPGFETVERVIEAAWLTAGGAAAAQVLKLPAGHRMQTAGLSPVAAATLDALADLEFELHDAAGLRIATDLVRLADPGDGRGVRVYAYFRHANAGVVAVPAPKGRDDQNGARGV